MIQKKLFLLVALSLFILSCDGQRSEQNASSYTSQSEILDMQEEEYGEEFNKADTVESEEYGYDKDSSSFEEVQKEEVEGLDQQDQSKNSDGKSEIDNTSSEADDTIY